jgi:type VI protein secretion system component VasK
MAVSAPAAPCHVRVGPLSVRERDRYVARRFRDTTRRRNDKFFAENLDKLVDKSQRQWSWREGSVHPSAAVLPQFERAERIRQMFFSPGAKLPEVNFVVRLSNLDPTATRFYLNIDG